MGLVELGDQFHRRLLARDPDDELFENLHVERRGGLGLGVKLHADGGPVFDGALAVSYSHLTLPTTTEV